MKYLIFLLLPILAACNHNPPVIERVEVLKRVNVPAELLLQCPELKTLSPIALQDLLHEDLQYIEQYGECRLRHKKLIEAVKDVVQ